MFLQVPVILYHGTPDERTRLRIQIRKTTPIREGVNVQPVVITSYEITMRDRTSLQSHDWKILIVDEGHRIKNTHCRLIRCVLLSNVSDHFLNECEDIRYTMIFLQF